VLPGMGQDEPVNQPREDDLRRATSATSALEPRRSDWVRPHLQVEDEAASAGLLALETDGDQDLAAEREDPRRKQQEEGVHCRRQDGPDPKDDHAAG
jgi:hypothetical protein